MLELRTGLREDGGKIFTDELQKSTIRVIPNPNVMVAEVVLVTDKVGELCVSGRIELVVHLVDDDAGGVEERERAVGDPSRDQDGDGVQVAALEEEVPDLFAIRVKPFPKVLRLDARQTSLGVRNNEVQAQISGDRAAADHPGWLEFRVQGRIVVIVEISEAAEVEEPVARLPSAERTENGDFERLTDSQGQLSPRGPVVKGPEVVKTALYFVLVGCGEMVPVETPPADGGYGAIFGECLAGFCEKMGVHTLVVGSRIGDLLLQGPHRRDDVPAENVRDTALGDLEPLGTRQGKRP